MGLTILRVPHNEVAPHGPLQETPAFEYYPGRGDAHINGRLPTCKVKITARNHLLFLGDSNDVIYGTLEVQGEPNTDGIGFTFKFDNVRFKEAALNIVWSIRASAYIGGQLVEHGEFDLPGILVTPNPRAPFEPIAREDRPRPEVENFATF